MFTVAISTGAGFCSSTLLGCNCHIFVSKHHKALILVAVGTQKGAEGLWHSAMSKSNLSWTGMPFFEMRCDPHFFRDVDGQGMHKWYSQGATSQLKMNPGQKSQVEVGNWTTKLWMMWRDVLGVLHLDNHFIWSQCSSWNWWWDDEMFIFAAKGGCRCDTLPLWSFSSAWFLQCAGHGEPHGWDCAMPSHYLSQLHACLLNAGLVLARRKGKVPVLEKPKVTDEITAISPSSYTFWDSTMRTCKYTKYFNT